MLLLFLVSSSFCSYWTLIPRMVFVAVVVSGDIQFVKHTGTVSSHPNFHYTSFKRTK